MKLSYKTRWGKERTRVLKGHPKRKARQERAYARGAPRPGTLPNLRRSTGTTKE